LNEKTEQKGPYIVMLSIADYCFRWYYTGMVALYGKLPYMAAF